MSQFKSAKLDKYWFLSNKSKSKNIKPFQFYIFVFYLNIKLQFVFKLK